MSEIEFEIIYPKVYVYKNVFKDTKEFLEKAKSLNDWQDWYTFGTLRALQMPVYQSESDKFPTFEEFMSPERLKYGQYEDFDLAKEIETIFYRVTSHYVEKENIVSDNWFKRSSSINRYFHDDGISEHYAMNLHTDFVQTEKDWPGPKYLITTTYYLNDDYEDGEIVFKINEDYFTYKPKAGDVIVFPSQPPYYHGVRKPKVKDRYMIRNFWQYSYPGDQEWLKNEEKYGKEVWANMEQERIKVDRHKYSYEIEAFHEQIVNGDHK